MAITAIFRPLNREVCIIIALHLRVPITRHFLWWSAPLKLKYFVIRCVTSKWFLLQTNRILKPVYVDYWLKIEELINTEYQIYNFGKYLNRRVLFTLRTKERLRKSIMHSSCKTVITKCYGSLMFCCCCCFSEKHLWI